MSDDPADGPRSRTGDDGAETVGTDESDANDTADGHEAATAGGRSATGRAETDEGVAAADTNGEDPQQAAAGDAERDANTEDGGDADGDERPPADVRKYERFKKVDGAQYDRVNDFLRERTYITAREWAIARLCADFRTETGVEMTKIGNNLPELVPFMTDTYSPQAVNQARHAFRDKVRKSGATFLYGAMCGFFTAEELDELMYEVSEIAKFLLEVEGVDLAVAEELEAEERISSVMREVREASSELRAEDLAESVPE
ncbi:DUF5806 family protein [Salinigranum halophilum]|jgi:hypothetical protein|uniref:DUF5806 family protein n=1 Tax=Salinigranum halophilum TaxID=2565931 RepID=UPI0010A9474D|nr:DUF5806 family protein [Salinigranum halophilum]